MDAREKLWEGDVAASNLSHHSSPPLRSLKSSLTFSNFNVPEKKNGRVASYSRAQLCIECFKVFANSRITGCGKFIKKITKLLKLEFNKTLLDRSQDNLDKKLSPICFLYSTH